MFIILIFLALRRCETIKCIFPKVKINKDVTLYTSHLQLFSCYGSICHILSKRLLKPSIVPVLPMDKYDLWLAS